MSHAEGAVNYWPGHPLAGQPNPNVQRHPCDDWLWDPDISPCINTNHINNSNPNLSIQNTHVFTQASVNGVANMLVGLGWPQLAITNLVGTTSIGNIFQSYPWNGFQGFLYWQHEGYFSPQVFGGCNWIMNKIAQWNTTLTTTQPQYYDHYQSKVDWGWCMWDQCCNHAIMDDWVVGPPSTSKSKIRGPLMGTKVDWNFVRYNNLTEEVDR